MPEKWEPVQDGRPLSLKDLENVAEELLNHAQRQRVWLFYGELGAGKTTLIKAIVKKLGVAAVTSSPTFSIVNQYDGLDGKPVYHFDFYRIRAEKEAFDIGTDEYFDSGSFCFVEWPEKIPSLVPDKRIEIKITPGRDRASRILQFARHD